MSEALLSRRRMLSIGSGLTIVGGSGCLRLQGGESSGGENSALLERQVETVKNIDGNLLIGTGSGLYRLPIGQPNQFEQIGEYPIGSILEIRHGVYMLDFSNLVRWTEESYNRISQFRPIKTKLQYQDGLVFGSAGTLYRMTDEENPTVEWRKSVNAGDFYEIFGVTDSIILMRIQSEGVFGYSLTNGDEIFGPLSPSDVGTSAAQVGDSFIYGNTGFQLEGSTASTISVSEEWTGDESGINRSVVANSDAIFISNSTGAIFRISPSFEQDWQSSINREPTGSNSAVANGMLYIGGENPLGIVALDTTTGDQVWQSDVSAAEIRSVYAIPEVGCIVEKMNDDEQRSIAAFGETAGTKQWELP